MTATERGRLAIPRHLPNKTTLRLVAMLIPRVIKSKVACTHRVGMPMPQYRKVLAELGVKKEPERGRLA